MKIIAENTVGKIKTNIMFNKYFIFENRAIPLWDNVEK